MTHMIPSNTKLAKVKLLDGDCERYRLLFNLYNVRAPFMNGCRIDVQTVVKDKKTNKHHLVIIDVLSDTLDWNPKMGIVGANSIVTVRDNFKSFVRGSDYMNVTVLNDMQEISPTYDFAVEANKMCYFSDFPIGYTMDFNEESIMKDVTLLEALVSSNLYASIRSSNPTHVFRHNHAMIFDVLIPSGTFRRLPRQKL